MTPKLTNEQSQALHASGDEMQVLDPSSNKIYVVVEQSVHQKAKAALLRQQNEDLSAIQQGIDDMNAGRTAPMDETHERIREKLIARNNK